MRQTDEPPTTQAQSHSQYHEDTFQSQGTAVRSGSEPSAFSGTGIHLCGGDKQPWFLPRSTPHLSHSLSHQSPVTSHLKVWNPSGKCREEIPRAQADGPWQVTLVRQRTFSPSGNLRMEKVLCFRTPNYKAGSHIREMSHLLSHGKPSLTWREPRLKDG